MSQVQISRQDNKWIHFEVEPGAGLNCSVLETFPKTQAVNVRQYDTVGCEHHLTPSNGWDSLIALPFLNFAPTPPIGAGRTDDPKA